MVKASEFRNPAGKGQLLHGRQPVALVLCDDPSATLGKLTSWRCKAAVPFAGKYSLIDFALSNCVNSGIETVGVITQYQPRWLNAHLAYGRPWGLDRQRSGLTLLHPYQTEGGIGWYTGSADALHRNLDYVHHYRADEVFVLAGGEVCCIDLAALIARHREARADLTVAAIATGKRATSVHGTLAIDREGWVRAWMSPESDAPGLLAATGVMLFSTNVLTSRLSENAQRSGSTHDLTRDVIQRMVRAGDRVMAFQHRGYWNSLPTVEDYWRAHMDLVSESPLLNLVEGQWPVRTQAEIRPSTRISVGARVSSSILCEGCVVEGAVEHSILSPGVHVAPGAIVRNAVVLHDVTIEGGAVVENAVLDMNVTVGSQARVGWPEGRAGTSGVFPAREISVVERGVHIPAHVVIEPDGPHPAWLLFARPAGVSELRVSAVG